MLQIPSLAGIFATMKSLFRKGDYVYILVMGRTGTGKTTFVNTATGSHLAVGSSLSSQTRSIQLSRPVKIDSKRVILIDTPGLDMTTKSTEEVVQLVGAFLTKMRRKGSVLHGTIYLHRISDSRMGHVALESLIAFRDLCAQEALANVAIVLSMWEDVNHSVRETRKYALCTRKAYFRPIMDAGAVIFHHDRTAKSAREIVRHLVANAPQPLQFSPDIRKQAEYDIKPSMRTSVARASQCSWQSEAPVIRVALNAASRTDIDDKDGPVISPLELPFDDEKKHRPLAQSGLPSPSSARRGCRPRMRRVTKAIKKFLEMTFLRHETAA